MRTTALSSLVVVFLVSMYIFMDLTLPLTHIDEPIIVEIRQGMTLNDAIKEFDKKGLTRDPILFKFISVLSGVDRNITPGRYEFMGKMSPATVYDMLREGRTTPWIVTILEGDALYEIKQKLLIDELIISEEFDALVADKDFLSELKVVAPSLEGYLFPDTYQIDKGTPAREVLRTMVDRLREKFDPALLNMASDIGLNEREVLTLASIIEKEAAVNHERRVISAVYHNRIKRGIPLQADPTAIYGIRPLSTGVKAADVRHKTAYNTYFIRGLPPGPIASPGLSSIKAAIDPENVKYIYFVSNNDGTHTFSKTLKEHLRAVRTYRRLRASADK